MIKYFAKKWILKQLNSILSDLKENEKVEYWKWKIANVIVYLNNIMEYLKDNEISDDEANKVIEEGKNLFK